MTDAKSNVAIIIVSWNTWDYLRKCLGSLVEYYHHPDSQIIVIDNASVDNSVAMVRKNFPDVHLICNRENLGFAKACNQGVAATHAPHVLLLNSDCELTNDCITPLIQVLENNNSIGIAGSVLLHPNGKIQKAGGNVLTLKKVVREQLFFRSATLFAQHVQDLDRIYGPEPFFKTEFVSGASLCVSRKVLDQIGLLREDFFMYGEDLELCLRAQRHGFETVIVKASRIIHHKSQSTNKNLTQAMQHSIANNCLLLAELEGPRAAYQAFMCYFIGGLMRMVLAIFRRGISPLSWARVLWSYPEIFKNVHARVSDLETD